LSQAPFSTAVKMNLGLTFELNEEYEKAAKEYQSVAQATKDPKMKFYAEFNLGRVYGELGEIEQALSHYQNSLEIKPESVETKTNIELLLQGGGGGGGKGKNKDKSKDGKGEGDEPQDGDQDKQKQQGQNQDQQQQPQKKKQPKPFNSKDLTNEDVRRILDELKDQENRIRASEMQKGSKESPRDKDW
jgi:Ca-activated chloride channel family protein